jgi:signal transduction histidine kinase
MVEEILNIDRKLYINYVVTISGVVAVAVLSFMLKNANEQHNALEQRRHASILLADELRQSSDDLTRFARTYVSTGDARYEKAYWDVLDIRNGKKPRPENYERIYWDLVLVGNAKPRPDSSEAVPLRELMKKTGVTEAEFAKLDEAQNNSDDLVVTERIAMNMVKGLYGDGNGNFTVKSAPDFETARKLMHDENYHKFKASIMKPLEEFQAMLDKRTRQEAASSFKRTKMLFAALQTILLTLFITTIVLFKLKKQRQDLETQVAQSRFELSAAQVLAKKEAESAARAVKQAEELEQAYSQLKNAQMMIFQQDKMVSIGQLAAGVAHEINNPMGFISSNLGTLNKYVDRLTEFIGANEQALASCCDSPVMSSLSETRSRLKIDHILVDSRQLIAECRDGADRVRRIVQDLKSFSMVDRAEQISINLNAALETTINIAWNEIKYVATLDRDFGEIPFIKCYPQQLSQVFLNLLVNAAQALGNSQGSITIRTWNEGDSIFVSVTDSGCGIPENIQHRIFEPFFTTKEVGKGTGLGLSISYDIIQKHGGTIIVASEIGVGTTFTVRLPLKGLG